VKLRYTLPALADLKSTLDYIAARSPQGGRRVQARIKAILELLFAHPHMGARTARVIPPECRVQVSRVG